MVKSILNQKLREELIARVRQLKPDTEPAWGTMNAFQMVKHCRLFEAWIHGIGDWDYTISRSTPTQAAEFLAAITSDDTPLMQFAPSSEILIVAIAEVDFEAERNLWIEHLEHYESYNNPAFIHDFFGKMTPEQIGILAYKHTDHHLRQFGE
jgi:hypothetical protein